MVKQKYLTFQELDKLVADKLSKQSPVTLEEARAQVKWLKEQSAKTNKRLR